ncbi:FecR family protein [Larkinella sp. GY13]|uniref:FecR family protein n=1 Tax=Larkinella sp. GY13 TaxID=3453720 RepID=UPI003EEFF3EC
MNTTVHKQLLFAHFSGLATPLQQRLIEEWLKERINQETYYEYLEEWDRLNLQYHPDEDRIWEKLQQQTQRVEQPLFADEKKTFRFPIRWVAAASLFMISLLMTGYLFRKSLLTKTIETAYGEVRKEALPDGSLVTLNAHSRLEFPRFGFGESSRDVFLTGQATFSVRHLTNHQPFIVHTNRQFDVTVLGTEFTVYARNQDAQVVLHQGKVQIDYQGLNKPERLTMLPGDMVKMDVNRQLRVNHYKHTGQHKAWQYHQFVFDQTSLRDIARLLEENYGLQVSIRDEALATRTISGAFKATTAEELLQVVTELLDVNYNRQNDQILLFE